MKIITGHVSRPESQQIGPKSSLPNIVLERLLDGLRRRGIVREPEG